MVATAAAVCYRWGTEQRKAVRNAILDLFR